jgi:tetratricopeptide (TPR) repeat protein
VLFNIAAIFDGRGDVAQTVQTLRELVKSYPSSRESIDGHLYIAALQSDKEQFADALATLDEVLARTNLTYADRIEAFARKGYVLLELHRYEDADAALTAAIAEWRKAPRLEDPYYIAMAHYYRGELAHEKFLEAPARLPDDQLVADLEAKRVLAVTAYDRWKEALGFKQAYWATAAGYQMSQIFVELWEAHVKAPYPKRIDAATRSKYVAEVHDRVREHLEKALEGHRMNVELAKAFGVETVWSRASEQKAVEVMELLAKEGAGQYVTPAS